MTARRKGREAKPSPHRIGVLISGRGSNLMAILDRITAGDLDARVALVICNRPEAAGAEAARVRGIETLILDHRESLPGVVMIGVGAAFDFHAGRVRQAPGWMQQAGLEWLFRLRMEPCRLWRRYLLLNPLFLAMWGFQLLGILRYPKASRI